jgi:hypothetical protein
MYTAIMVMYIAVGKHTKTNCTHYIYIYIPANDKTEIEVLSEDTSKTLYILVPEKVLLSERRILFYRFGCDFEVSSFKIITYIL